MSILYEKKDKIAIVTINRPEAINAIDPETSEELGKAWMDFRDDPNLWVGILTGAGDRAFSAGADLKKMIPFLATISPIERREREEKFPFGGLTWGLNIWKPIIAAINGFCLAGGVGVGPSLRPACSCGTRQLWVARGKPGNHPRSWRYSASPANDSCGQGHGGHPDGRAHRCTGSASPGVGK